MDDVAEQQELANEISDAISNPVGFGQEFDDVIKNSLFPLFTSYSNLIPNFNSVFIYVRL